MNKIIYTISILIVLSVFYSCDSDTSNDIDETRDPIILSASGNNIRGEVSTKAAPDFPNNGEIGILAGYYTAGEPVDWKSYDDISNARATVGSVSADSVYSFKWDQVKYWPFDNRELAFMAYSPKSNDESVFLDATNSNLLLSLHDNMPDVLYASANDTSTMVGYSKSPTVPVVDLGQFRHALSQLTIEVHGAASMPSNIVITSLKITTHRRSALLNLQRGDNGLMLSTDEELFIYTIISSYTAFKSSPISETVLLFPGTEDITEISISLFDGGIIEFSRTYMMSYFVPSQVSEPLTLERGKNTTLRLTVEGIPTAGGEISLQGVLSDWNQKGNFQVNIN